MLKLLFKVQPLDFHPRRAQECSAGEEPHEGINLAATDLVLQVRGPRASSIELKSVLQVKIWRA
jgi:hypothetical protein